MSDELNKFNEAYTGNRPDVQQLIPDNVQRVLDCGCSVGALGEEIAKRPNKPEVCGIELDEQTAQIAKSKLDRVIIGNLDTIDFAEHFQKGYFDCIIFSDVLEHTQDPWGILKNAMPFLNNDGFVIISIPNIRHYTTICNLIFRDYWPYRERGLHDKTHLRFFTLKSIKELCENAGLQIQRLERNYRIYERPHYRNRFAKYLAIPFLRGFLVFQYLIVAKKRGPHGGE